MRSETDGSANRATALAYIEAFYGGDVAAAQACCDPDVDFIVYAPIELYPHLGQNRGRDWIAESIGIQEARYRRRQYDIRFVAADGDQVAVMLRLALEKRNDGRVVRLDIADFFTLRDGLIAMHRVIFDSFDLTQQLLGHDLTDAFAAGVRAAMTR